MSCPGIALGTIAMGLPQEPASVVVEKILLMFFSDFRKPP